MHAPCVPTSKSRRWIDRVITVITIIVYYERIEIKIAPGAHWITPIHFVYACVYVRTIVCTYVIPMSMKALLTIYAGSFQQTFTEGIFLIFFPITHRLPHLIRIFNYSNTFGNNVWYIWYMIISQGQMYN